MSVGKLGIKGSDYIGSYALATDKYLLLGAGLSKYKRLLNDAFGVDVVDLGISGSDLIGLYVAANSNSIILPNVTEKDEYGKLKKELPDKKIGILESDINAVRNNILLNDKIAIINPEYAQKDVEAIKDILDVEVVKMSIGKFKTVGANNIITNKGLVLNNRVSDEEFGLMKELVKSVSQSTANMGSLSIGLCTVANSKGLLAGTRTTGYELANLSDGLEL